MITQKAERDLREIYAYIAETLLSPENAERQLCRLETGMMNLRQFPKRHKIYSDKMWHNKEIRIMPVDNFLIFYISNDDDKIVTILRVMYSKRDFPFEL